MLGRLARSRFVRNVAVLSSGQTIAQVLTIAASPILTRLFEPDAFGSFGLLISLSSPLIVISGLRYELAVVTAKSVTVAANLLALSCAIVLLMSGLAAGLVGAFGTWIAALVERPEFEGLLWWLPVFVLAEGTYQAFTYWSNRRSHYRRLAISRALQSLSALSSQIMAGLANLGLAGLVVGRALGQFIAAGFLAVLIWRDDRSLIKASIKTEKILEVAKQNSQFPKYNAPQNFINSLSIAFIPYTLAAFFGVEIVGFFYLAQRVMGTPSAFVSGSLKRVFLQSASDLHNQGKSFYPLLVKTFLALFSIGIIPVILLLFYGPEIFTVIFGAEWRNAGVFVQWLVNWWFLAFIAGPAMEALTILKLQKYLLFFRVTFSSARVLSILLGAMIGDHMTAIASISIVGVVFNLILIVGTLIVTQRQSRRVVGEH